MIELSSRPTTYVTIFKDITPCKVPSRSSITSGFQNITLLELLVVVGVDNKAPNAITFSGDFDVFGTRLVGNSFIELGDHLFVGFAQGHTTLSISASRRPVEVVFFDVFDQGGHFVIHSNLFRCFLSL